MAPSEEPKTPPDGSPQTATTTTTTTTTTTSTTTEPSDRLPDQVHADDDSAVDKVFVYCTLCIGTMMLLGGAISLLVSQFADSSSLASSESGMIAGWIALAGGVVMTAWGWILKNSAQSNSASTSTSSTTNSHAPAANNTVNNNDDEGTSDVGADAKDDEKAKPRGLFDDEESKLPFDKLIVGGTLSLGIMMLIGAAIILAMSLGDKASFSDASTDDFQSLGPEACRIQRTVFYELVTERLDALNSICREEYQYQVQLVEQDDMTFVSTILARTRCRAPCEFCRPGQLYGEQQYVGVDLTRLGEPITNKTLVECWAPTKPVNQLSDFYQCGLEGGGQGDPKDATNCYQLTDTSIKVKDVQGNYQTSMVAAIIGLVGAVILTAWGCYFVWRNQRARKEFALKKQEGNDSANEADLGGSPVEAEADSGGDLQSHEV